MELILWRHAEAEPGEPDEGRALTPKGHKQAWKMAEWLDQNLPNTCRILVSPTRRTVQTAEALGRKFKIHPGLAPDATPEGILSVVNWPDGREPVLVVGHQPTLGQVAALVLTGNVQDWTIRKSTALWIGQKERGDASTNYLKAVMAPDLMVK
ncbi:MAG TPA: histidine phosphatase family protein [Burkholderiaceae bacterium]|jgi:phosphohistidine phosphatase|nr:histidine phosphatase family protein [Burkholderiaceae bacterium]